MKKNILPLPGNVAFQKKIFIIVAVALLFFCGQNASAQENNFELTSAAISSNPGGNFKLLSSLDGTVFACGGGTDTKRKDTYARNMIEKLSHDSTSTQSQYISLTLPGEDAPVPAFAFAMLNDKLYAFAETSDLKERILYGNEIDQKTLRLTGSLVKIFTFRVSAVKHYYSPDDFPVIKSSLNEEKLLFSVFEKTGDDNTGYMYVKVFENDLQPAWEKKLGGPSHEGTFYIKESKIYDNGNLQVMGCDIIKGGNGKDLSLKYHVMLYSDNGETILDRKIYIDRTSICSVFAEIIGNGKMVVTGSYQHFENKQFISGIFYMLFAPGEVQPSFSITNQINSDLIPDNMLQSVYNGSGIEEWSIGTFMRSMFVQNDGSAILIAEHKKIDQLKELLVFSLDPDGKLIWTKQIFKSQTFSGTGSYLTNSFKAFAHGDDIIIFFNDNTANALTKNDEKVENYYAFSDQGMLVSCTINSRGEISKQKVCQYEGKQKVPGMATMIQTGPDEFSTIAYNWKLKSGIIFAQLK
jgi:hypothetical protein